MAFRVRIARATAAVANNYVGKPGQLLYDTTNNLLYMHDGMTVGGHLIGDYDADQVASIALDTIALQADKVRDSIGLKAAPWAYRNRIQNSRMNVWQRGTRFDLTSDSPVALTADRWVSHCGDGAATITRDLHVVGAGLPRGYMGHNQTTAATNSAPYITQRIEGVRSMAGKRAYLKVNCSSTVENVIASMNIDVYIKQYFGSGGSPSAAVNIKVGTIKTKAEGWDTFLLSFDIPTIDGKTLGSNGDDYLALRFELPKGVRFGYYFWEVQLEEGLWTPTEIVPFNLELAMCQRFCEVGNVAIEGYTVNGIYNGYFCPFVVTKRAAPVMTIKNTAVGGVTNPPVNGGSNVNGFRPRALSNGTGAYGYTADFEANAEYPL